MIIEKLSLPTNFSKPKVNFISIYQKQIYYGKVWSHGINKFLL